MNQLLHQYAVLSQLSRRHSEVEYARVAGRLEDVSQAASALKADQDFGIWPTATAMMTLRRLRMDA